MCVTGEGTAKQNHLFHELEMFMGHKQKMVSEYSEAVAAPYSITLLFFRVHEPKCRR